MITDMSDGEGKEKLFGFWNSVQLLVSVCRSEDCIVFSESAMVR